MRTKTLPKIKIWANAAAGLAERTKRRRAPITEEELEQKIHAEYMQRLKSQLGDVRKEIQTVNAQFNDASEPECIAYYAYLLKATEAKYDYLLRLSREAAAKPVNTGENAVPGNITV